MNIYQIPQHLTLVSKIVLQVPCRQKSFKSYLLCFSILTYSLPWFISFSITLIFFSILCGDNTYILIYIYIYTHNIYIIYSYIYIYTNLPVIAIVRLPFSHRGDSQGQEMFLATSADKKTHNYDIECSKHHPSLSILRPTGLSHSKMKW